MIAPAGNAGLVALKPTVGLISTVACCRLRSRRTPPGRSADGDRRGNELNGLVSPEGPAIPRGADHGELRSGPVHDGAGREEHRGPRDGVRPGQRGSLPDRGHRDRRARSDDDDVHDADASDHAEHRPLRAAPGHRRLPRDERERHRAEHAPAGHRLRQRRPLRGTEVRTERTPRRRGREHDGPGDDLPPTSPTSRPAESAARADIDGILSPARRRRDHGPQWQPARGHRRPRRLPGPDRPGRLRPPDEDHRQ